MILADDLTSLIGTVAPTQTGYGSLTQHGLIDFFTNVLRLVFVIAGLYALVNFIAAGFQFMSAGGDTKAVQQAWNKIMNSLIGLVVVVGSFALAALFSQLIFGNPGYILNPTLYGPGK